jgi:surface protein
MFQQAPVFNQNIGSWDVSNVTSMFGMFNSASAFNQDLSGWDVGNVLFMNGMFLLAIAFNNNGSALINNWNTSNLASAQQMFRLCNFNQPIGNWDVSSVGDMNSMFRNNNAFNQDIGAWDISGVLDFGNFMTGKTDTDYLATYLDSIYNTWSTLAVQPNLTINFGTIKYTLAGQAGKNILDFAPNNWSISDGGI